VSSSSDPFGLGPGLGYEPPFPGEAENEGEHVPEGPRNGSVTPSSVSHDAAVSAAVGSEMLNPVSTANPSVSMPPPPARPFRADPKPDMGSSDQWLAAPVPADPTPPVSQYGSYRSPALPTARPEARFRPTVAGSSPNEYGTRAARLRLVRIDPWSATRVAFLLAVATGIVAVVATVFLWVVLRIMGVFDAINRAVDQVFGLSGGRGFNITQFAGLGQVIGLVLILSLVNIVLITGLGALSSYLYNAVAGFVGGVEVTLTEDS
jgi:hypothetical protein